MLLLLGPFQYRTCWNSVMSPCPAPCSNCWLVLGRADCPHPTELMDKPCHVDLLPRSLQMAVSAITFCNLPVNLRMFSSKPLDSCLILWCPTEKATCTWVPKPRKHMGNESSEKPLGFITRRSLKDLEGRPMPLFFFHLTSVDSPKPTSTLFSKYFPPWCINNIRKGHLKR